MAAAAGTAGGVLGEAVGDTRGDTSGGDLGETPGDTSGGDPGETPGDTSGGDPGETPGETSGGDPGETPGGDPGETPGDTSGGDPGETPGETSGGDPGETRWEVLGETPADTLWEVLREIPGDTSEDTLGEAPEDAPEDCGDALEEKLIPVMLWLKRIYGDQPIPEYEVNEKTVDILYDLMECNEATDRDVSLLIEEMKHQETKYKEQAQEIEELLREGLGLSLSSLSDEATKCLNEVVESAMALETGDTSLTSFFCAINNRSWELFEKESENREMEHKWNIGNKKLLSALALEKQLQEDIKKVEERQRAEKAKIESRAENLNFLRRKSLELKIRIRNAEEELIARGLDKTLTHEALVKFSEELAAAQKELIPLRKELKAYHDLPPSIALARVKVEEAKRELNALEDELSKELDKLSFELT